VFVDDCVRRAVADLENETDAVPEPDRDSECVSEALLDTVLDAVLLTVALDVVDTV
jgi:hypothetical protein